MEYFDKRGQEMKEQLEHGEEGFRLFNPGNCRTVKIDNRTPYRYHLIKGTMLADITDNVYEAVKYLMGG